MPSTVVTGVARGVDAVATLLAEIYPRKLVRVNVNGPAGSSVAIYIGPVTPTTRIDSNSRGASNTADYGASPEPIPPGTEVNVVWPTMAAQASACNATLRTDR